MQNISESKFVKFQIKIPTVAEKTAKNFRGYYILLHPVHWNLVIMHVVITWIHL